MKENNLKKEALDQLRKDMLVLQGFKQSTSGNIEVELGEVTTAFPNEIFPTGAVHEFISHSPSEFTSASAFVAGIVASLMRGGGACVWITSGSIPYSPALLAFGIKPDRVFFLQPKKGTDLLWCVEEALKYEGLAAVVSEIQDLSFIESRRLQLVVEKSRVTCFLLRQDPKNFNTASIARWKIIPAATATIAGRQTLRFPQWEVTLLRIKNGKPGTWSIAWSDNGFRVLAHPSDSKDQTVKTSQK